MAKLVDSITDRAMPGAPAGQVARETNSWLALAVICLGFFAILLDTTIVNIAVPTIIGDLHASLDEVLWVINAYLLAYAVLLIPAGRLGDRFGQRDVFIAGLIIFTLASAACGLARNPGQLIAARVLQGVGGGLLAPQGLALITGLFPENRRGAALGMFGGLNALAAIGAPILGGWILVNWGWRWIFELNLPVGLVAVTGLALFVPNLRSDRIQGLDPVGVLLVAAGLLALCFGLLEGERYDWSTIAGPVTIPLVIGAGIALLAIFAGWEARNPHGLVPTALFGLRGYLVGNIVTVCIAFAMLGMLLPLVLFFQAVLGLDPLGTGIALVPAFAGMLVAAPLAGRLADRIGGKPILLAGAIMSAGGLGAIRQLASASATSHTFIAPLVLTGVGMGFTAAPLFSVTMAGIGRDIAGAASGFVTANRQLGAVLGTALIGGVLQSRLSGALHERALELAPRLPQPLRAGFVQGLSTAVKGGARQLGRGPGGGAPGTGLPGQLMAQLQALAHQAFTAAFVDAMRPTIGIAMGAMLLAAVVTLLAPARTTKRLQGSGSRSRPAVAGLVD